MTYKIKLQNNLFVASEWKYECKIMQVNAPEFVTSKPNFHNTNATFNILWSLSREQENMMYTYTGIPGLVDLA